jgi:alpha-tubulin suppressor-like RCC1 family protein
MLSGKSDSSTLHINAGPFDHLVVSPSDVMIAPGGSQAFSAEATDAFGNPIADETANTVFSIGPDGSCSGAVCTAGTDGDHTVKAALKYTAIATGTLHSCARTAAGGYECWGDNGWGALGDPDIVDPCNPQALYGICSSVPVPVPALASGVTSVSARSSLDTCAVTTGGGAKCWGWNNGGQLGNGTRTNSSEPVNVSGLTSGVAAISAGGGTTCALTTGGGVTCWGVGGLGGLGNGTFHDYLVPVDVSGLSSGVAAVSAGGASTCALTTGGGVKCWGSNIYGELGDGGPTTCAAPNAFPWVRCSSTPVDVSGLTSGVVAIAKGDAHVCALTTGGGVKCWGRNDVGQLGIGDTSSHCDPSSPGDLPCSSTPVDVSGLTSGVAAISAGTSYTCALMNTGGVKCWGSNGGGQLGNGTTTDAQVPVDVSGLTSGVAAVSAGNGNTCAVMTSGGAKCWGHGWEGELGNGTTIDSHVPVDVDATKGTATVHVGPTDTIIDSGPSGLINNASASFSFHSNESSSTFQCRMDSSQLADWQSCSSPKSYGSLADGSHTFEVRATNGVTGTDPTPASRSFTIDTHGPTTTIDSGPAEGSTSGPAASVGFSSADLDLDHFECSLDGDDFSACTSPKNYTNLHDGPHSFTLQAFDGLGNQTQQTRNWMVDATAPSITIDSSPPSLTNSPIADLTFSTEPGATTQCQLDGGAFASCSSPFEYTGLSEGGHRFHVVATDAYGNHAGAFALWTIDLTPPTTRIKSAQIYEASRKARFVFASGDSKATFRCALDHHPYRKCTSPKYSFDLQRGRHTFKVYAVDLAGNRDLTPAVKPFVI